MAYPERLIPAQTARNPIESCWMCGIRLPTDRLVPDGSSACPDIRWYCQDLRSCTERWTSHRAQHPEARTRPQAPGTSPTGRTAPPWQTGGRPETVGGPGAPGR